MIMIRTVPNVMEHYDCSLENAQRFCDLREEGYPTHQALLMAGLSDPPEPPATCKACHGSGVGSVSMGGEHDGGQSAIEVAIECPECNGSGLPTSAGRT